jgi:biopolymer transport protein ExbD
LLDPVLISADCNVTFSEVIDVCREYSKFSQNDWVAPGERYTTHNTILLFGNSISTQIISLFSIIHEPTRITQNTGNGTLLDPVLISADCNVTFSEVIDVFREKSDHNEKFSLHCGHFFL